MKKPKIIFQLEVLSSVERKKFEAVLKTKKRKQLIQLYKIVIKQMSEKIFSNEKVYKLLYNSPYQKSKNYLLRNELRLLSNELKSFFVEQAFQEKIKSEPDVYTLLYLQAIIGKSEHKFFLSECEKAIEAANKNLIVATQIQELAIRSFIQHTSPTYESYLDLKEKLITNEQMLTQAFLENWIDIQKFKAFTLKSLNAMHTSQEKILFPENLKLEWKKEDQNSPYFHYQLLWTKSFASKKLEKIKILKDAEQYISEIKKPNFSNESEYAKVNASIALDYFLLGKYQLSVEHYEKVFFQTKFLADKDLAVYLFNYISTLLRMDDFNKAVQLIFEHEKLLLKQERLYDRFLNIKAMCLLLLNRIEEAETCLPSERKEGGMYNYFYFRVVQSMIFFERRIYDLAINEIQNLQFSIHYNQLKDSGFKELTIYLQSLYKLSRDQKINSNYQKEKQKLKSEIKNLGDEVLRFQYLLPYKWLLKVLS